MSIEALRVLIQDRNATDEQVRIAPFDAAVKQRPDEALVDEFLPHRQAASGDELRHSG